MRTCFVPNVLALFLALAFYGSAHAATPQGNYVFSGKGVLLLNFDANNMFTGVAALPSLGVVSVSGILSGESGQYELRDRNTAALLESGGMTSQSTKKGFRFVLGIAKGRTFIGQPRDVVSVSPSGLFSGVLAPANLLYQFVPGSDPQIVTLQGDQDFFLDLNLALGGQLLFDRVGRGYGVVYENGDPTGTPRWATARYRANGALNLRVYSALGGGTTRAIRLSKINSGGKYDGVYSLNIIPDSCILQTLKITIKNDVISGSDTSTGALTGAVDINGNFSFTTERLTVADSACAQAGAHASQVVFTGEASAAAFPRIIEGTFAGAGVSGAFNIAQPVGVTGATTTTTTARQETWSGTLSGSHVSKFCTAGEWTESYTIALTFPSDLIAALRGKTKILSGSATMAGAETVKTQPPSVLTCTYQANTLASTNLSVIFAGDLSPEGGVIDLQSSVVLIPSTVQFTSGTKALESENLSAFRLRMKHISATSLDGVWAYGKFKLKKK